MELVCARKLELDETIGCKSREINLEYYLLKSICKDTCTYGMQINMTKDTGEIETIAVNDVLNSRDSMIDLIKLLHSNSVTPVSALDVIYDFLA